MTICKSQFEAEIGGDVRGWKYDGCMDLWEREYKGCSLVVHNQGVGSWMWHTIKGATSEGATCGSAWEGMKMAKAIARSWENNNNIGW